jgi:hypothetical protein
MDLEITISPLLVIGTTVGHWHHCSIGLAGAGIIKLSLATITIASVPKPSEIIYNCSAISDWK